MKHYVAGFMFSENREEVLLIEKQTPEWQRGLLNGIGGKLEPNETLPQAMVREFQEETGVSTTVKIWKHYATLKIADTAAVACFFCFSDLLYGAKSMEIEKVQRCLVQNLPENTMYNLCWLIPMALDEKLAFDEPIVLQEK